MLSFLQKRHNALAMQTKYVVLVIVCQECRKTFNVMLPRIEFNMLRQDGIPTRANTPSWSSDERNLYQYHVCAICWDVMHIEH